MGKMERLLYDASIQGNVTILLELLQQDPLILDKHTLNCYDDMPLHVASMLGHINFVKEIINRKPEFTTECDSQKRLPIHLAAAKGHVEIVKALISVNREMCGARDRDGKNAIHIAAIKGRYEVVKELMQAQPHTARAMVQHDTILHLCVKYNQLEVLKLLIETIGDYEFVNTKDMDGNTILHLAVADKQIEFYPLILYILVPSVERVVYSTCSVHQIENEDVIKSVLPVAASYGFQLATPFPQWARRGLPVVEGSHHLLRTDPVEDKEGFFIALFTRNVSTFNDVPDETQTDNFSGYIKPEAVKRHRYRKMFVRSFPFTKLSKLYLHRR